MGRSASRRAGGGGERHPGGGRPSVGDTEYRRPAGENADGLPTIRNIIPWKDMEKQVAERLAAKAARGELDKPATAARLGGDTPAPDSGVRPSGNSPVPGPLPAELPPDDGAPLSFAVYTVADLEKNPRPPRMSMAYAPEYVPPPTHFTDAYKSLLAIPKAFWAALLAPKPRPRIRLAMQEPFTKLRTDVRVAIANLPWKKIAIGLGIAFGTLLVLLFIVLTAAELTDDLKPAQPGTSALNDDKHSSSAKKLSAPATTTSASPAASASGEPEPAIEIDEEPPGSTPAAASTASPAKTSKPAAKPRPKPAASAGKKKGELFNP